MKKYFKLVLASLFLICATSVSAQVDSSRIASAERQIAKDQKRADKLAKKAKRQERKQKRHEKKMQRKERKRERALKNIEKSERKLDNMRRDTTRTSAVIPGFLQSKHSTGANTIAYSSGVPGGEVWKREAI